MDYEHPTLQECEKCGKEASLEIPTDDWLYTLLLGNWMIFDGEFICAKCRGKWNGKMWIV